MTNACVVHNSFTPGNLVVVQVGDGTANVPNAGTQAVAMSVLELNTAALPLAPGGLLINVGAALSSAAYPYQLTALGEAADVGGLNKPYSGKATLSVDGQYIALVGYNQGPGASVGAAGAYPAPTGPAPAADRIVALMNYAGQIVNAVALTNQRTGLEATDIKGALFYNASGRAGLYVIGGWSNASGTGTSATSNFGGLWWLPLASAAAQPAPASAVQVSYAAASSLTQTKFVSDVQVYQGQLYEYKTYQPTWGTSSLIQVGTVSAPSPYPACMAHTHPYRKARTTATLHRARLPRRRAALTSRPSTSRPRQTMTRAATSLCPCRRARPQPSSATRPRALTTWRARTRPCPGPSTRSWRPSAPPRRRPARCSGRP